MAVFGHGIVEGDFLILSNISQGDELGPAIRPRVYACVWLARVVEVFCRRIRIQVAIPIDLDGVNGLVVNHLAGGLKNQLASLKISGGKHTFSDMVVGFFDVDIHV